MAIGDDASSAGFPLVPNTGPDGLVRWGAQEINRTRDMVAEVKGRIKYGTAAPTGGDDGDIYFKVI